MFDTRILNGLSVFIVVVDTGSFVRAGEVIGVTKSGVSRAIARLEERTGLRLFDRTSRALKLTDEGRLFYDQMSPLLDQVSAVALGAVNGRDAVRGRLRVSTDAAFGHHLLAPRLGDLFARHPDLHVDLIVRDRVGDLIADGFDVAVRFGVPDARDVQSHLLLESRVLTCAAPSLVRRLGPPLTPGDLLDARYEAIRLADDITGKPHPWHLRRGGELHLIEPRGRLVLNDAGALLAATLAGLGISRLLDFTAAGPIARGELVELLPDWNGTLWPAHVYYAARAHPSPAVRAFVEFAGGLVRGEASNGVAPRSPLR